MRLLRRGGAGWVGFVLLLVLGVAAAGTVAVRNAGAPSGGGSAELLVAGVGTGMADPTTTTVMTVPPMPTSTSAPRAPSTATTSPGPARRRLLR